MQRCPTCLAAPYTPLPGQRTDRNRRVSRRRQSPGDTCHLGHQRTPDWHSPAVAHAHWRWRKSRDRKSGEKRWGKILVHRLFIARLRADVDTGSSASQRLLPYLILNNNLLSCPQCSTGRLLNNFVIECKQFIYIIEHFSSASSRFLFKRSRISALAYVMSVLLQTDKLHQLAELNEGIGLMRLCYNAHGNWIEKRDCSVSRRWIYSNNTS